MQINEIISILDEYIRQAFEIGEDPDYATNINLFDYGFLDSLGAVDIIEFIENKFSCEITQKDITLYPMNTVEEIATVVYNKIK